ncbi:MAG TPA: aldo/keto reductase [Caulobacteraceae bacterium]|nr:aldo/keto reductase [Caulobacteraceae bacterium]
MSTRLALSTDIFDSNGVNSASARASESTLSAVLEAAAASGVADIDTQPGDGDVERTLGCCWPFPSPFQVTIKTLSLEGQSVERVEARARRSLDLMGLARGYAVLVQHPADLLGRDGHALWTRLQALKAEGVVQKVGVVMTMEDAPVHLARRFRPDLIQINGSILDQRPDRSGVLHAFEDLGCELWLRSVFLNGLLFMPREDLPPALADAGPRLSRIRRMLAEAGADPMQAALAYARSRPEVSAAVIDVRSAAELKALAAAASQPQPSLDWPQFALDDPTALDPQRWARVTGRAAA